DSMVWAIPPSTRKGGSPMSYRVAGFNKSFDLDHAGLMAKYAANDPKRAGICYGLSIIWTARLMLWHHETPQQRLKALLSDAGLIKVNAIQDVENTGNWATKQPRIFTAYSLTIGALNSRKDNGSTYPQQVGTTAAARELSDRAIWLHKYFKWDIIF